MKKNLLIIMMVICLLVVGCSSQGVDGSDQAQTDNASESENENVTSDEPVVINLGLRWLSPGLDPIYAYNSYPYARIGSGQNLVQFDENMEMRFVIAESYEQIDDLTVKFKIREGVKFHNGNICDAEACKASIERVFAESDREDVKFPLDSIEADGLNLTIKTTEPCPLVNNLANPVFIIVDASVANEGDFLHVPVSTGPFKVTEYLQDEGLKLVKHEEYWGGDFGVDILNAVLLKDDNTRAMALQSGDVDVAPQISPTDLALFEGNDDFIVQKGPSLLTFYFTMNHEKSYMKDLEFRQAIKHALDVDTYATKIAGGSPARGPFMDMFPFSHDEGEYYEYSPEKSMALLDELGYIDTDGDGIREIDGENISLRYLFRSGSSIIYNNVALAIQTQLREVGIGMEIIKAENTEKIMEDGTYDFHLDAWTAAPTGDPQYYLDIAFRTGAFGNDHHYSNAEFDAKCDELALETDLEKRYELGQEAVEILLKDVGAVFMYYQGGNIITSKDIGGVRFFPSKLYLVDEQLYLK